ncbi:MAG: F0F1 ATP synthase subunit A [Proteobacteria bacterium]|nr:F0F1 ATP synthase subunit A [Pseudomonadota bacterium]MBU4295473.1 F0F1 ATP synthase subunit A [Pseudomonadota bacterium]MCG2747660.1 F0F1 ATP synthase subunit A [Desulfobulbaceae bacterium]
MEHPILFISVILQALGLPVPHTLVGETLLAKLVSPHLTYTWLVMAFLIIMPKLTLGKLELVPNGKQNFWEVAVGGLETYMADQMGPERASMMFPMIATFAFYILVSNLMGLMPGFMSPTSNLNITLGMTLIVWVTHHILGLKYHGIKYIKHFTGPMVALIPLMLPIEIISNLARILSLSIRLFGNIMAKETLLAILFMLYGAFFGPLPILCLGVLVSVVQTMVFVLLSILYCQGAMEHAH